MLGRGFYPITIAEMETYQSAADEWFKNEEGERLKEFLAFHPESGEIIPGTGGCRRLRWPIKSRGKNPSVRIVYYFRDLNMPLYLFSLHRPGEVIDLGPKRRQALEALINELVAAHSQSWATILRRQNFGA
jgi:hypothetical protein